MLARKRDGRFEHLRAKIVIVGSNECFKHHHFVLNYLTVLVYTKQLLFTSVSVVSGGYLPRPPPLPLIIVQYLFHVYD